MKKEWLMNAATGILVLCALVITGLAVRREFFASHPTEIARPVSAEDWRRYAGQGQSMGPRDAAVTLVEFSDFQCPACRALSASIREMRAKYPNDLRVVYRHFPLAIHAHAAEAARASECAAAQGRFEAFHDALFGRQDSVGVAPWSRYARAAGVPDLAAFERCARDTAPLQALARDQADGNRLGVTGTPTMLINRWKHVGAPPAAELERLIVAELRSARQRVAQN